MVLVSGPARYLKSLLHIMLSVKCSNVTDFYSPPRLYFVGDNAYLPAAVSLKFFKVSAQKVLDKM